MRKRLAAAITATLALNIASHAGANCDARQFTGRWTSVAHVNGADFNESLYCEANITGQENQLLAFQNGSHCARVPGSPQVSFGIRSGRVTPTCEFHGSLFLAGSNGTEELIMNGAKGERSTDSDDILTIVVFGYYAKSKSADHPRDRPTFTMTFYRSR